MTNEQVVRDACRVVWTEGDLERVGEFYAEDFVADYPRTDWGTGVEGVRALAAGIRESFPDYRERIDELIVADDLGINDLSTFGGGVAEGRVPTPNIDRLAAEGAIFTQAYSGSATCAPSQSKP